MRVNVNYKGFDEELDKDIRKAMKSIGFKFTDSGSDFETRDLGFEKK